MGPPVKKLILLVAILSDIYYIVVNACWLVIKEIAGKVLETDFEY